MILREQKPLKKLLNVTLTNLTNYYTYPKSYWHGSDCTVIVSDRAWCHWLVVYRTDFPKVTAWTTCATFATWICVFGSVDNILWNHNGVILSQTFRGCLHICEMQWEKKMGKNVPLKYFGRLAPLCSSWWTCCRLRTKYSLAYEWHNFAHEVQRRRQ